ncbi:tetratricopeptide repeat protein [Paludibacter jiangxiensis]|nr:hypothetical protein [Paludibacter jiangxiensis]
MANQPDSSIALLKKIPHPKQLKQKDYALYALLMCQGMDKCGIDIKSDSLIKEALNYYDRNQDSFRTGYVYLYLSRIYRNQENDQKRSEALIKAIPYAVNSKDNNLLGFIYADKAAIYQNQGLIDSMMFYYKKSLRSLTIANDKRNRNIALLEIGYGYFQKGDLDSALYYYKKAEQELVRFEDKIIKTSLDRLIGVAYLKFQNYPSALQYLRSSIKTSDSYDYHKYILLSQVFLKTGEIDSTHFYLKKYLQTKQDIPEYYDICSELTLKKGNLSDALKYSRMYLNAKNAEYKHYLNTSLNGLEKKLNFEKVEAENQKLTIKNQRFTIIIALVTILCFIIAVIILIEQIKKNKLALKNEADIKLINQQKIKLQTERISKITILQNLIQLKLIPERNLSQIGAQYLKLFGETNYSLTQHTEDIIKNIDVVFDGFSQKLLDRFPSLTQREILVCCCLRAGINQESILSMLSVKSETYYHYRSNIRKKMNAGQDDKVEQILSAI